MQEGSLFALAGLYDTWKTEGQEPLWTCTLITTAANEQVRPIHNRMPVILRESDHNTWLNPGQTDVAVLQALLRPFDAEILDARPVTRYVNSPARDDERCIEPIWPLLPYAPRVVLRP